MLTVGERCDPDRHWSRGRRAEWVGTDFWDRLQRSDLRFRIVDQ
jgi:hypothetical protein